MDNFRKAIVAVVALILVSSCTSWRDELDRQIKGSIDGFIRSEVQGESPPKRFSWESYWVLRCEILVFQGHEKWVDYVVEERHRRGLPTFDVLSTKHLRTPWQYFTDLETKEIDEEANGGSPPLGLKSWNEWWQAELDMARHNKNIGERGVIWVKGERAKRGLPEIKERSILWPF